MESLIEGIRKLRFVTNLVVADLVAQFNFTEEDVSPYLSYNHAPSESYGRKLIYDNGNFKIMLMSWCPGDFTAIHNHGGAEWGCINFLGEATHRLYSVANDELKIMRKCSTQKGQIAPIHGNFTHIMGNSSDENFTTLHVYGSNTRNHDVSKDAVLYLPERGKEVTTSGAAYLNMEAQQILNEKPLIKVSPEVVEDYYALVRPYYKRNGLVSILDDLHGK